MTHTFECNLEVPAWTNGGEAKYSFAYRPRLTFLRYENSPEFADLLMRISAWVENCPGRDRWMVQFYPPDRTALAHQEDEGDYFRQRRSRRLGLTQSTGELREPRDTPAAAVQRGLELLSDVVPKADLASLEKIATLLRPALERTTQAYLTRFRPKA